LGGILEGRQTLQPHFGSHLNSIHGTHTNTDRHARTHKKKKKTIHRITQEPLCESIRFLSVAILVLVILVAKVGEISEAASPLITANTHTHTGMSHKK